MIVTCADARLLAHAERDERAGDAHHDVEYGDARNSAYLRRLVSGRGEEPPLASTHGLGERRRTFALSRVEQLRSLRKVIDERCLAYLGPPLVFGPSSLAGEHLSKFFEAAA